MSETSGVPGHVFVIHGKLQDVTCDAALIPTDTSFSVREHWWRGVVGLSEAPHVPNGWTGSGCAPDRANGRFWYLDITDEGALNGGRALTQRLTVAVRSISGSLTDPPVRGRARHLIVMPLLGSGGGGLQAEQSVRVVFDALVTLAEQHSVDLAIVVPHRSEFEALQRQRAKHGARDSASLDTHAQRLGRLVQQRALSLMIGAGVSMGAGLPSWAELLDRLKAEVGPCEKVVKSKQFEQLPALDQAELLERLLQHRFADTVIEAASTKRGGKVLRPALGHFLLAGLDCPQVATTNYDLLYESAVASQGDAPHVHALPYERPQPGNPWILKLHGDTKHRDDLVLSRSSFIDYHGRRAATGAVFQSMLMTSHVLFVGLSFTDDNVLRLTHEVTATQSGDCEAVLGTALDLGSNPVKRVLWEGILDWVDIETPPGKSAPPVQWAKPGEQDFDADARWEMAWQVRELEIFLDTVALWSVADDRPDQRRQ